MSFPEGSEPAIDFARDAVARATNAVTKGVARYQLQRGRQRRDALCHGIASVAAAHGLDLRVRVKVPAVDFPIMLDPAYLSSLPEGQMWPEPEPVNFRLTRNASSGDPMIRTVADGNRHLYARLIGDLACTTDDHEQFWSALGRALHGPSADLLLIRRDTGEAISCSLSNLALSGTPVVERGTEL